MLKPILQQASFFGVLALGAFTLKQWNRIPMHPIVQESQILVQHAPNLASLLSLLAGLGLDEELRRLVRKTQTVVEHDRRRTLASQWHISRMSSELVHDAKAMCKQHSLPSDDIYRTMLFCEQEVIPQMEQQLQDLLHNHLLDHRGVGG